MSASMSPGMPVPQPVPWFLTTYPSWLPGQKTPIYVNDAKWQARAAHPGHWFPSAQPHLEPAMSRAPRIRPPA